MDNYENDIDDISFFAVRDSVLNNKTSCKILLNFVKKDKRIFPLTVITTVKKDRIYCESPFILGQKPYDLSLVKNMEKSERGIAVIRFLNREGEKSVFFYSVDVLIDHLKSILKKG